MSSWKHLIRFQASDDQIYFASLASPQDAVSIEGQSVEAFSTIEGLQEGGSNVSVTVKKVR